MGHRSGQLPRGSELSRPLTHQFSLDITAQHAGRTTSQGPNACTGSARPLVGIDATAGLAALRLRVDDTVDGRQLIDNPANHGEA